MNPLNDLGGDGRSHQAVDVRGDLLRHVPREQGGLVAVAWAVGVALLFVLWQPIIWQPEIV
jgi:hypothetical protein